MTTESISPAPNSPEGTATSPPWMTELAARGGFAHFGKEWRERRECTDVDPELFFPIGTGDAATQQANVAKQVCQRCEVALACLRFAVGCPDTSGVWGEVWIDNDELTDRQRLHVLTHVTIEK